MRKLNAEQERARAERKARLAALIKRAGAMPDAERQAMFAEMPLVVNTEGKALSPRNTMLIHWQIQSPTIVGGFRQWLKQGRCVRKGEHGATILFPRTFGKASEESGESQAQTDADGKSKMAFLTGTVFDIAQTQEMESEVSA